LEAGFEGFGERDEAVFPALGVVDGDGAMAEVDVFDAEAEALIRGPPPGPLTLRASLRCVHLASRQSARFHDTEAGAVEELGGEFPGVVEEPDDGADLVAGEYGGRATGAGGRAIEVQREFGVAEDVAEEEDEGVERLFLGGGGDLAFFEPEAGPPAAIRQGAVADAGGGEVVVVGIGEGGHGCGKGRGMEDAAAGA
jgi:hypothetical protein